jgi:hypothetical protein
MKIQVTIIFLFVSLFTFSQTEKGNWLVGGNVGFQTGENTNQFIFNPNVGAFVSNNLAFGGNLNFNSSKFGDVKSTAFGIGPFIRYYIGKAKTKPFLVSELNFLTNSVEDDNFKVNNSGVGWLLGLGFAAFINDNVAIEGVSGYNYAKYKDADGSGGFALRFGFQVYLNKNGVNSLKTNITGE